LDKLSDGAVAGSILGVVGVTMLICLFFLIPYFHRRLVLEDWTLRWYHVFIGPTLYFRGPVPPVPQDVKVQVVQDYYRGHITKDDLQEGVSLDEQYRAALARAAEEERIASHLVSVNPSKEGAEAITPPESGSDHQVSGRPLAAVDKPEPFYKSPTAFWLFLKRTVLRGLFVPVIEEQSRQGGSKLEKVLAKNVLNVHARAHKYDNKTEYLYSMLQAFTATTASFAHGYLSVPLLLTLVPTMWPMQWVR
jgi:solute carrier family 20 (sodium-dependent phosphate transporter)